MADDKQDAEAAKAYETAAGKLAGDKAKPAAVKAAKPAVKKPAPKKKPAAKLVTAAPVAPTPAVATVDSKVEPVKADAPKPEPEPETTEPVKAETPPVKAEPKAPAVVAKEAVVRKPAAKKAAPKAKQPVARKALVKKAATKKITVAKPTAKPFKKPPIATKAPVPAKVNIKIAKPVATATASKILNFSEEFTKMTSTPEMMTKSFQDAMSDMSAKTKEAFGKGSTMFSEAGEFAKGNLEAMVESSKIFASGMQEMSRAAVADGKSEFEALTAEVKGMASVKSPTDFFQMQSALLRKNFDKAVAMSSKNTEAVLKLANEAAQPLSSRMSLAIEKVKAA